MHPADDRRQGTQDLKRRASRVVRWHVLEHSRRVQLVEDLDATPRNGGEITTIGLLDRGPYGACRRGTDNVARDPGRDVGEMASDELVQRT